MSESLLLEDKPYSPFSYDPSVEKLLDNITKQLNLLKKNGGDIEKETSYIVNYSKLVKDLINKECSHSTTFNMGIQVENQDTGFQMSENVKPFCISCDNKIEVGESYKTIWGCIPCIFEEFKGAKNIKERLTSIHDILLLCKNCCEVQLKRDE